MTKPMFAQLLLVIFSIFLTMPSEADAEKLKKSDNKLQPEVVDQLHLLIDLTADYQASIDEIDREISATSQENEIQRLIEKKNTIREKLEKHQKSIEQIATGAVDLSLFEQTESKSFSLQEEIEAVIKPILYELKKITERPRQIEELRGRLEALSTKLEAATLAVNEIEKLRQAVKSEKIDTTLQDILEKWQQRRDELDSNTKLIEYQLNEKMVDDISTSTAIIEALKSFFTGRGLNLLIAIAVFIGTFVLLRYFGHVIQDFLSKGQDAERRYFGRIVHIVFQVLTAVMALLALMATLYILSDWLLLSLLVIIAIGFIFALRHSLPKYLDEARLLLNMGPVREGERVIYQGLPWRISRLNLKSDLVNPLLTGGRLKLPMKEMLNLISRRWSRNEPWFPCKPDDYVILADNSYGKIILQTPEVVQIQLVGGEVRSYPTLDFLSSTPTNLSEGFGLFVSFGLDYNLQQKITSDVLDKFEGYVSRTMSESKHGEHVKDVHIEFEEASASSLNLIIIAKFSGEAAEHYYELRRFLQHIAVDACNENEWSIPFTQLTVHMASGQ